MADLQNNTTSEVPESYWFYCCCSVKLRVSIKLIYWRKQLLIGSNKFKYYQFFDIKGVTSFHLSRQYKYLYNAFMIDYIPRSLKRRL